MEQRMLPPEFENRPRLTRKRQTLAAAVFVVITIVFVALVVWLKS